MSVPLAPVQRLKAGDLVGVVAPSGAVEAERLDRGVAALERLGFRVRVPEGILAREGFSAGSARRRIEELQAVLGDPAVRAVFCARGGAGIIELLPLLEDATSFTSDPRPLVGYSDATLLHLLVNGLGLVTFHGPMVARGLDGPFDEASLMGALTGVGAPYVTSPGQLRPLAACEGEGEGLLLGGCLSMVAAASGTRWALRPSSPTLLLLEDIGEAPYRIHRLLSQLRLASALENVSGIVFGEMPGCEDPAGQTLLEEAIQRALEGLAIPVAIGLPTGHTTGPGVTLPLGVPARLECLGDEARFTMLGHGVA